MNNFNDSNTSQHVKYTLQLYLLLLYHHLPAFSQIDGIRHCESAATDDSTAGGDVIKVSKKYSSSKSLSRLRGLDTLLVAPPPAAIDLIPDINSGSGSGALKTTDALPFSEIASSSVKEQPDYELPKGYISSSIAAEVVDVYRRGGRLSRDSVHKILRLGYRNLKQLGNTVEVEIIICFHDRRCFNKNIDCIFSVDDAIGE